MTTWASGRLDERSDLPSLNQWLSDRALEAQARGTAATYVWTAPGTGRVVAYYAIAPHQVRREQVSAAMAGGATAYLLARLASMSPCTVRVSARSCFTTRWTVSSPPPLPHPVG